MADAQVCSLDKACADPRAVGTTVFDSYCDADEMRGGIAAACLALVVRVPLVILLHNGIVEALGKMTA